MVIVDKERCHRFGRFLGELKFPEARKIDPPLDMQSPDLRMLYFIVVAICHQTSPIGRPRLEGTINSRLLYGWDYFLAAWLRAAKADPSILTRDWFLSAQASDVVYIVYDHERKQTAHITDAEGRAGLIRNLGVQMYRDCVRHVDEYYRASEGYLFRARPRRGESGLMSILSRFEAYGLDPVKKKLTLFLILMNRYGFWDYHDIKKLGAPVDYHEVRLHLRLGTVKVIDPGLLDKISGGSVLTSDEDVAIRMAVHQAIFEIAEVACRTPADLHSLFWNMARNCCRREETHCHGCGEHPSLPEQYREMFAGSTPRYGSPSCIFGGYCVSVNLPFPGKPKEPVVDTIFY